MAFRRIKKFSQVAVTPFSKWPMVVTFTWEKKAVLRDIDRALTGD